MKRIFFSCVLALTLFCQSAYGAAIDNLQNLQWVPAMDYMVSGSSAFIGTLIDAASEKAGFVFMANESKNIHKIGFRTGTVTTGATIDVRIETVDTTTGFPTGTLWAANTNNPATVILSTDDNLWFTVTLVADATLTSGTRFAVVIENPVLLFGNMNIISFVSATERSRYGTAGENYSLAYTSSWSKGNATCPIYIEYSDGTAAQFTTGMAPSAITGSQTVESDTSPDELGNKFQLPYAATVYGAYVTVMDTINESETDVVLYDSDGTTALGTATINEDCLANSAGTLPVIYVRFSSTISLLADTYYRLVFKPQTANNNQYKYGIFTFDSTSVMDAMPLGQYCHQTERTDAGAWTDTTTNRVMSLGLILEQTEGGAAATTAYTYVGS